MSRDATPWFRQLAALIPAFLLVAMLVFLATLQVRWLEQMRAADAERSQADLEARLQRVADEFNRRLGRLFIDLQPLRRRSFGGLENADDVPAFVSELLASWKEKAVVPEIVADVFLLNVDAPPWRLDPLEIATEDDVPQALREAFAALQAQPSQGRRGRGSERSAENAASLLLADVPAILIPLALPPTRSAEPDLGDRDQRRRRPRRSQVIAVQLDPAALVDGALTTLLEEAFGDQPEFRLRLLTRESGDVLLEYGAGNVRAENARGKDARPNEAWTRENRADAAVELFGPLSFDLRRGRPRTRNPFPPKDEHGLEVGQWRLEASHAAGSLDAAINGAHRRNLAVSLGILAVLAAALLLLARGAARSRRLARQQLDFVAGMTHELMTPLAALRSAGQNLADGVVHDRDRIERYGRMIDREGHRLSELVGQVLAFSRMQSGPPDFRRESLDPAREIGQVLEEMRPTLDAAQLAPVVEIEQGAGQVFADAQALRRALANLISNAVKYGQDPADPWLHIRVESRGGDVLFQVMDRGPGIAAGDRTQLFEPFFRGSGLAGSRVPGSGLGLALVRHLIEGQGGRVEVRAHRPGEPNSGAAFTLRLPAAPTRPETEE